jgi:hypothetical protein
MKSEDARDEASPACLGDHPRMRETKPRSATSPESSLFGTCVFLVPGSDGRMITPGGRVRQT